MTRISQSSKSKRRSPGSSRSPDPEAARGYRLAAIGGGSGLAVLLRGLKEHVGGAVEELTAVEAPVVLALNLMTQPGETDGMADLLEDQALIRHDPGKLASAVLSVLERGAA